VDEELDVEVLAVRPTAVDLVVDGVRRTVRVHRVGPRTYVDDVSGSSCLTERERFPEPELAVAAGSLVASLPGAVVRVLGQVGDVVDAGDTLVVIEAMKMEHRITCPAAGVVAEVLVQVGEQVETGQVLAVVTSDGAEDG
jgi:propionyl-CoA carboxylase alpha chain